MSSATTQSVSPGATRPWPGRRIVRLILATGLAAILLTWLLEDVTLADLALAWQRLPGWAWALAAAAFFGTYLLRAYRLRHEWAPRRRVSYRTALRVVLLHSVAVQWLPLRSGELAYPLLVKRHFGAGPAESTGSLLWLRLQDACVLGVFAVLLLPPWPVAARALFAVALAAALTALLPWGVRLLRRRGGRFGTLAAAVLLHRNDITGWVCCAGHWTLKLAVIGALLSTLAGAGAAAALRGALGGEVAGALPLQGPAGIGSYEFGVWAAVRLGEVPGPALVVAAVLVHSFVALVASIGAAAVWATCTPDGAGANTIGCA